jgi:DNA-binding PadR family transcriptional regulator
MVAKFLALLCEAFTGDSLVRRRMILCLLRSGSLDGRQLVSRSHGMLRYTAICAMLGELEDGGFVISTEERNGMSRRLYMITAAGREVLAAQEEYEIWKASSQSSS